MVCSLEWSLFDPLSKICPAAQPSVLDCVRQPSLLSQIVSSSPAFCLRLCPAAQPSVLDCVQQPSLLSQIASSSPAFYLRLLLLLAHTPLVTPINLLYNSKSTNARIKIRIKQTWTLQVLGKKSYILIFYIIISVTLTVMTQNNLPSLLVRMTKAKMLLMIMKIKKMKFKMMKMMIKAMMEMRKMNCQMTIQMIRKTLLKNSPCPILIKIKIF